METSVEDNTIDVAAIAAKVAALLAKAEDPASTPEEAQAFHAKAMEMMVKYEINSMTLDAGKNGEVPIVFGQFRIHTLEDKFVVDERIKLASVIARNFECKTVIHQYYSSTRDIGSQEMVPPGLYYEACGYKGDFEMVAIMYYHLSQFLLSRVILDTGRQQWKGTKAGKKQKEEWERSIAVGFAHSIDERLRAMHGRVNDWAIGDQASSSTAVAIRSRLQRVQEKFMEKYPPGSLGSHRSRSLNLNHAGYQKGQQLGREANLSGGDKLGRGGGGGGSAGALGR